LSEIPEALVKVLQSQKYHIIGRHSGVKKCRWTHESLVRNRTCYKQKFYGIPSHRCVQMSPALVYCNQACLWCWRVMAEEIGAPYNEMKMTSIDEPELIVQKSIEEQRRILSGYNDLVIKGIVDKRKYREALAPNQVAISLSGEPTLYPKLGELIDAYKKRDFTALLVTNGTIPDRLGNLEEEPTQLYVTVGAPDEDTYFEVCRPKTKSAYSLLMISLELMNSFSCPTVFRMTTAKCMNMKNPEGYARLVSKFNPTYVEVKAAMSVGYGVTTGRMRKGNMPSNREIREFASDISRFSGYPLIMHDDDSRVSLLSKLSKPIGLRER